MPVSMSDADIFDAQDFRRRGYLQPENQRWQHLGHQVGSNAYPSNERAPPVGFGVSPNSTLFDFHQWTAQLAQTSDEPALNHEANVTAYPGFPAFQHTAPFTTHQALHPSHWNSSIGTMVHDASAEMREMGSWAPLLSQGMMDRPSSSLALHSAELSQTMFNMSIAEPRQPLYDLAFEPPTTQYNPTALSHSHLSEYQWSPVPERLIQSPQLSRTTSAASRQDDTAGEITFDSKTGDFKLMPGKRRHRPQTPKQLANRRRVRKGGGACARCKKQKRRVLYIS